MKKLLQILSSPVGEASYSTKLSNAIVEKLQSEYPGSTLITRDVSNNSFPHLEGMQIASFYTPPELRTAAQQAAVVHADTIVQELMDADILIIGVPMHNFTIPSTLKAWIDHVVRAGVTFRFTATGAEGLVQNKKAYLAIATGNIYAGTALAAYDLTESYLRSILGFIGITDIVAYRAEGTAIPGVQDTALQKAMDGVMV